MFALCGHWGAAPLSKHVPEHDMGISAMLKSCFELCSQFSPSFLRKMDVDTLAAMCVSLQFSSET